MSDSGILPEQDLVGLTRLAAEARGAYPLVCAQYELRSALRRLLVAHQWAELEEARQAVASAPSLAARFKDNLHAVLELPELGSQTPGTRWHGLVLVVAAALASRSGTLVSLPHVVAQSMRESLEERFPTGTGIRLLNRPVPQLAAHSMTAQALQGLVDELASGAGSAGSLTPPDGEFAARGRSLGLHYFFALALTTRPEQLGLEMPDFQADPRLAKWAADQTERITSDFAERGWPLLMRVSPPRRLREMLSSLPVLGDVRELDGLLEHCTARPSGAVETLRAELALSNAREPGVRIAIADAAGGAPIARVLYRFAAQGAEAAAYRVAVRLASAGVELVAADESLSGAVQRAVTLASAPEPPDAPPPGRDGPSRHPRLRSLPSRFARSPRQPI